MKEHFGRTDGMDDRLRLCNCADCGIVLLGKQRYDRIRPIPERLLFVSGRIDGRPYCYRCLHWRGRSFRVHHGVPSTEFDTDPGPWQENAIRAWEDESCTRPEIDLP